MRARTRILGLLVSAIVALGTVGLAATPAAAAGTLSISGTVYLGDASHPAAAGEVIVRYGLAEQPYAFANFVTTDAAGHYTIGGLESNAYSVYFEYAGSGGFSSIHSNGNPLGGYAGYVSTTSGSTVVDKVLPPTQDFVGVVSLDTAGHPANANVTVNYERRSISSVGSPNASWLPAASVTVGADGTYTLPALSAGIYRLWFDYTGSGSVTDQWWRNQPEYNSYLYIAASPTNQLQEASGGAGPGVLAEMVLPQTAGLSVSGKVSLGSTSTAAGAGEVRVYYRSTANTGTLDVARSALTDAAGNYTLTGLDAGYHYLYFEYLGSSGYLNTWHSQTAAWTTPVNGINVSASVTGKNQTLTKAGSITGVVSLQGGGTAPAGDVLVSYIARTNYSSYSTESTPVPVGADGSYTLAALPPGSYQLHFTYAGAGSFQSVWYTSSGYAYQPMGHSVEVSSETATTRNFVQPATLQLSGTVYLGSTSTPAGAGDVVVTLEEQTNTGWAPVSGVSAATAAGGTFAIGGLKNVGYRATYTYVGSDPHVAAVTTDSSAIVPAAGRNKTLATGLVMAGTVSLGDSSVIAGAGDVTVEFRSGSTLIQSATTNASGYYSTGGIAPGNYTITFRYLGAEAYRDLVVPPTGSTSLTVDRLDYDATLDRANWISGQVVDIDGNPIPDVFVYATGLRTVPLNFNYAMSFSATTDADGRYVIKDIPDGKLKVSFTSTGSVVYAQQSWPFTDPAFAQYVDLASSGVVDGIDAELIEAGTVEVSITAPSLTISDYQDVLTTVYTFDFFTFEWVAVNTLISDGVSPVTFQRLTPGFFLVETVYDGPKGFDSWQSDVLEVGSGSLQSVEAHLLPVDLGCVGVWSMPVACRISGEDRFNVSATISRFGFDPGVDVVYIANGLNYPDALSAAPAASLQGGPLLLVSPTTIPAPIAAEITRLNPDKIVVVGGTGSVSSTVFNQLAAMTDEIVRIGGVDRYEASRGVAEYAFGGPDGPGAEIAYITTGRNFPDALSAGGAASNEFAPVITVDGLATRVDPATKQLLIDLGVDHVKIAGGPASVSNALMSSIDAIPGVTVERLSGEDRYEASGNINRQAFTTGAGVVFLSTGLNYPDALSGGALAGAFGSPIYVIPPTCIPQYVLDDIEDFGASAVIVLGGPASVAESVLDYQVC